jgi:hypothetical protein
LTLNHPTTLLTTAPPPNFIPLNSLHLTSENDMDTSSSNSSLPTEELFSAMDTSSNSNTNKRNRDTAFNYATTPSDPINIDQLENSIDDDTQWEFVPLSRKDGNPLPDNFDITTAVEELYEILARNNDIDTYIPSSECYSERAIFFAALQKGKGINLMTAISFSSDSNSTWKIYEPTPRRSALTRENAPEYFKSLIRNTIYYKLWYWAPTASTLNAAKLQSEYCHNINIPESSISSFKCSVKCIIIFFKDLNSWIKAATFRTTGDIRILYENRPIVLTRVPACAQTNDHPNATKLYFEATNITRIPELCKSLRKTNLHPIFGGVRKSRTGNKDCKQGWIFIPGNEGEQLVAKSPISTLIPNNPIKFQIALEHTYKKTTASPATTYTSPALASQRSQNSSSTESSPNTNRDLIATPSRTPTPDRTPI